MKLSSNYVRIAIPHGVDCPYEPPHKLGDALSELFEPDDKEAIRVGQAAMLCPNCGQAVIFPNGWLKSPIKGGGQPVVYWSQAKWDAYTPERQEYVRFSVPNVERYLK
jgi:hypothetical protein